MVIDTQIFLKRTIENEENVFSKDAPDEAGHLKIYGYKIFLNNSLNAKWVIQL